MNLIAHINVNEVAYTDRRLTNIFSLAPLDTLDPKKYR